jgi:hypothetical protein
MKRHLSKLSSPIIARSRYTTQRCFISPVKEQSLQMGLKELIKKPCQDF